MDSNKIRDLGFEKFRCFSSGTSRPSDVYQEKMAAVAVREVQVFLRKYRNEPVTEEHNELAQQFSKIMLQLLQDEKLTNTKFDQFCKK